MSCPIFWQVPLQVRLLRADGGDLRAHAPLLGRGQIRRAVVQGVGLDSGSLIENLPRYVASVALATSFGFAVFISPGGLGVREALLSALLTPYFALILTNPDNAAFQLKPEALATLVSLVQRIISMIAEVSIFVVLTSFNVNLRAVLKRR